MKIRTSFVTNSSSSSFIIAHSNQFTPEQKERLAEFALKHFLGDVTCSTEEELVDYFNDERLCGFSLDDFIDENDNIIEAFDENDKLIDKFTEKYRYGSLEIHKFIESLKAIKQGYSVSFGCVDYEDDIPEYTLKKLQKDFWKALKGDNFYTIKDDLNY